MCKNSNVYTGLFWILITVAFLWLAKLFIFDIYIISSNSMFQTFKEGDLVLVNKTDYGARLPFFDYKRIKGLRTLNRNDVLVLFYPAENKYNINNKTQFY